MCHIYTNSSIPKCARRNILTEVFQIIYADNLPLSRLDRSPYFQLCRMWTCFQRKQQIRKTKSSNFIVEKPGEPSLILDWETFYRIHGCTPEDHKGHNKKID